MNKITEKNSQNRQWLFFAFLATFIWGLAAHAYCFTQNNFSHDSLKEFNGAIYGNTWKIELGRFVVPVYRAVFRTVLTLPWLIGVLSLLWIGLAVYFAIRIFHFESKITGFLTAGIFTVNITVTATAATYLHDFDCDMFALFCAVLAAYLWSEIRWGALPGAVLAAIVLGIYQSYISVTIVLVMFVCILALMDGESFKNVLVKGLKAVGMILLGGILYYVTVKMTLRAADTALVTGEYNSLYMMFRLTPAKAVSLVGEVYRIFLERLLNVLSAYPDGMVKGITILLLLLSAGIMAFALGNKVLRARERLLCLCLIALLPLGMNLSHVLTLGVSHDLMVYAIWLFYLLPLLLAEWLAKQIKRGNAAAVSKKHLGASKAAKYASMVLVFVLLYGNVQLSNSVYLKKDQEHDAYLSLMTRVVYKMEDHEAYNSETPVVFVGLSDQLLRAIPGFEKYSKITGVWSTDVLDSAERARYQAYFDYVLIKPMWLADDAVWNEMQSDPRVNAMPCYPNDGCIAVIDNVMVVKLGESIE